MMKCVSSADIQTLRTGLKIKAQPSFSSSFKFNILLMSLKRIAKTKSGYIGNVISISKKKQTSTWQIIDEERTGKEYIYTVCV